MDNKAIETAVRAALEKGDQIQIIPVKDGARIFRVARKEIARVPLPPKTEKLCPS